MPSPALCDMVRYTPHPVRRSAQSFGQGGFSLGVKGGPEAHRWRRPQGALDGEGGSGLALPGVIGG